MAVEDGAALGVLFSDLTSEDEVPQRLELFQKLRFDRVSAIQLLSSVGQDEIHKVIESARPYFQGSVPSKSFIHPTLHLTLSLQIQQRKKNVKSSC
jgi:salicylate hydroxylase